MKPSRVRPVGTCDVLVCGHLSLSSINAMQFSGDSPDDNEMLSYPKDSRSVHKCQICCANRLHSTLCYAASDASHNVTAQ